jgi:acetolactate synthase-1/2/3 large subunit
MTDNISRTGGQILVDQLRLHGVEHVFCVPGESYLAALDAFHDSPIAITVCRHESGAAFMADAYGKLTGAPGICFVTRGPGATNASAGLHVAQQDSTPLILFVGQIDRKSRGRDAFQEVDYRSAFGSIVKWVVEIDDVERIPEVVGRAFHVAVNGRPGPVVVALPEDVLTDLASVEDARRFKTFETAPQAEDLATLKGMLSKARRPLVIAGGTRWDQQAVDHLVSCSETFHLPVAVSFRRQSLFPASHPNYVGDIGVGANPELVAYAKSADFVLLLGGRLSESPSQRYTLFNVPVPAQTFVHVHPGEGELGRVYQADLSFNVSPKSFCASLASLKPDAKPANDDFIANGRAIFERWNATATQVPGSLNPGEIVRQVRAELPDDAIIANGAGNYATWVHRFYRFEKFGSQLAPISGSMGYGVPAAVGASRINPKRPVVAFAGDGCFMMTGQEFATAVQYNLPVIIIVLDNAMLGTIRMHQETHYPGRVVATGLHNPDFSALAKAYGGHGETVKTTDEFLPAFRRARASGKPAILHCFVDQEAITPAKSLSEIRNAALAKKKG